MWETYGRYIIPGIVLLLIEALIIIALLWERRQKRIVQAKLTATNQRFELALQELRGIGGKLINAQEQERKRIARELHDDITQRLAVLHNQLHGLQAIPDDVPNEQLKRQVKSMCEDLKSTTSDVQALSHRLHSSSLEYLGLVPAIKSLRDDLEGREGAKIDFIYPDISLKPSAEVSLALFRITQEALHNALKHSGSKAFEVHLSETADKLELKIRDFGVGFGPDVVIGGGGLGLISMRERILALNGTISIVSKPGEGTEITARVPVGTVANLQT